MTPVDYSLTSTRTPITQYNKKANKERWLNEGNDKEAYQKQSSDEISLVFSKGKNCHHLFIEMSNMPTLSLYTLGQ